MVILFSVMVVSVFPAQGALYADPQHKLQIGNHEMAMQGISGL